MGFLRRLGKGITSIASTLLPGPIGAGVGIIGGQIFNGGGSTGTSLAQASGGFPSLPSIPQGIPGMNNLPSTFRPTGSDVARYQNGSNGMSTDIGSLLGGDRIVMPTQQKVINTAPPGWVVVDMPDGSGKKAVRKEVARCLGLWKARSKPPISASDWKKLKTAKRVENKAKKIASTAGFKVTAKSRR